MSQTAYVQFTGEQEANERLCDLLGEKFRAYRRQWEQVSGCSLLTPFPLFLVVELHYRCNLRCIHCVHGYQALKSKYLYREEMEFELYRKIIDEASQFHCPSLNLNSTNEPLLTKDLARYIRYAADQGFMDIMVNTNGVLLTDEKIEALLDSGLTRLMVSLDAFTKETYQKIRIGSDYDLVLRNIESFVEKRRQRHQQLPLLRVSYVRLSVNEHEIGVFIDYWRTRADYIAIQEFASPEPDWERFEALFADSRTILQEFSCPQPWQRLVIEGNGAVLPCCSQFGQELTLGNVKDQSIASIWRSTPMESLRKLHKEGRYRDNPTCRKCVSTWVHKT